MAEFFSEYGLFLAKTLTAVFAILFVMAVGFANATKSRKMQEKGTLSITGLNEELDQFRDTLQKKITKKQEYKEKLKLLKKEKKAEKAASKGKPSPEARKRVYVMDFEGDIKASQVSDLRKVITAVLTVARPEKDEVLVRLESPGGMVHAYGLAASQLRRIRDARLPLTICVDKVAASGGYMMACIGDTIVASPFAYIGSVGVLMQLPNFHRLLEDNKIDYEMITAGEYKRTLTMFGENTEKGRQKVTEEIQEAHDLFKDFIRDNRPALNVDEIASGETWFGTKALEKGLVDVIRTSDECIAEACKDADVFLVSYEHRKKVSEKLGSLMERAMERALDSAFLNWAQRTDKTRFY